MLRTPKERFAGTTHAVNWTHVVRSEAFEEAIYATLDELLHQMPTDTLSPQSACDSHQQMAGARKYMELLCSIHLPPETDKTTPPKGLDYSHGV